VRAREHAVVDYWRRGGCSTATVKVYLGWIRRFRKHCQQCKLNETDQLCWSGLRRFVRNYSWPRVSGKLGAHTADSARSAVHAWACAEASRELEGSRLAQCDRKALRAQFFCRGKALQRRHSLPGSPALPSASKNADALFPAPFALSLVATIEIADSKTSSARGRGLKLRQAHRCDRCGCSPSQAWRPTLEVAVASLPSIPLPPV
jgi:hypothetical protein